MSISNKEFVHIHNHSEYSSFDGLAKLEDLVIHARKMGFPALALTDHGTMGGVIKLLKCCKADKTSKGEDIPYPPIKPIIGNELYISKNRHAKSKKEQPREQKGNHHLLALASNWQGYQNLCTLSQRAFTEGFYHKPRIDMELLNEFSEGLIVTSGCPASVVNVNLLYGQYDAAKRICGIMKDIFKENFFIEIMFHGLTIEKHLIPDLLKISKELDIPVVASNDNHYIEKCQADTHDVFLAMSMSTCIQNPKRLTFPYKEFYLKSAEEMHAMFKDIPQVLYNTVDLADRVDSDDIENNLFGGMRLPNFEIPEEFDSSYDYLEHLAWQGLEKLGLHESDRHVEALKMELRDVKSAWDVNEYDFATYFLIVSDYIQYALDNDIPVGCGRGSGYASILLRSLGITSGNENLDILDCGLWGRFLSFQDSKAILKTDFF